MEQYIPYLPIAKPSLLSISSNVNCIFSDKPIVEEEGRIYVNDANALIINTTKEDDGGKSFVSKYTCWVRFS